MTTSENEANSESSITPEKYEKMQESPEFQELRRRMRNFAFPMTAAFFIWYMLYVLLSTYAVDFMGQRIGGSNITVGLVFGLLQFVTTFLITYLYVRHMNSKVDPLADQIREELEGSTNG